jgi:predicted unusual protein kinase regulating ubiquinone biosynthesis (AarF/ABC1/UbiB family)
MIKTINGILFLLNVLFIFTTEMMIYAVIRDYSFFIDRITSRLASINILYVKVFQAFALNNSLVDDKMNNKLLKFTDNAPWSYSDIDFSELIEITDRYNLKLEEGFELPINAGMISLVFKAYEEDISKDKEVIIKIKRKNIEKTLNRAIENLQFCLYILSFIPLLNKYQIVDVINNNIEIVRHQTNFLEEVYNMQLISENCKNLKYIKIPNAKRHITEEYPNVIVMDFIEGMKINQIEPEDYDFFAKQVIKFGITTTVIHGVAHGDLHSGNILFIKDKSDEKYPHKLGIIDFGIIYKVGNDYKNLMIDIVTQIFEIPPKEIAEKLLNSGIVEPVGILKQIPKEDYDNIIMFTEKIIDETININKEATQIKLYEFFSKLKDYLSNKEISKIGIRPSDDFIKSQMVLAMAHGVTLTLCKNNFIEVMDKCINELFCTNILFN